MAMSVNSSKSTTDLDETTRRNYKLMSPCLKRTCLSAESALTGRPNVEDVPLCSKLPMIPGNRLVLYTTNLCEKLHLPSCDFDRTYPSDVYVSNEYRCLHDPHLKHFFVDRPAMRKRLRRNNYITSEQKVICSLREYNLYRQYLKHLSIEYLNKKYLEQYEKEYLKNKEEAKRTIEAKQKDICMREAILTLKHDEDLKRRKIFDEKMKKEKKEKERVLIENYERKKRYHQLKVLELQRILAEEEMRRKTRIARWEKHFLKKHKAIADALGNLKDKDRKAREKENKVMEERLKYRGWTGLPYKPRALFKKEKQKSSSASAFYGVGDITKKEKMDLVRQLSAMGFHNVMMTPDLLKAMWSLSDEKFIDDAQSSGDGVSVRRTLSHQAQQFCGEIMKHGYASEYVRHVIEVAHEVEETSRNVVSQVIDVSRNVLLPMLHAYEEKTGVHVATQQIPETLHDLCSGVFDEEEDILPQIVSFNESGRATMRAGQRESNVRFVVSNTELPFELGGRRNRPPTPKRKVKFSDESSEESLSDLDVGVDANIVLEQTINQLSSKVVQRVFTDCNLVQPDISRSEMGERINDVAKSILDEVLIFGVNDNESKDGSDASSLECYSDDSGRSLEEKISHLARQLINGVVGDPNKENKDGASNHSSCGSSFDSTESSMSVLALRVVKSILQTVDPNTRKPIKYHTTTCKALEEKVAKLSAQVIEEVIKEKQKHKNTGKDVIDSKGYAELEEKLSKLALNIVTSTIEGKRPESTSTSSSICSAEIEERVVELSAHIVGGIISLKKLLPKDEKREKLPVKPSNSVERVLREIFNLDALENAPTNLLHKVTEKDIQKISDDIARRLVPPRDDSSAISSGISQLATALTGEAMIKVMDSNESTFGSSLSEAVDAMANTIVGDTLEEQKLFSEKSKISSAISEITQVITDIALQKQPSSQSALSSGASQLAGAVTGEIINNALIDQTVKSSSESAVESAISDLANTTVNQSIEGVCHIGSSTKSAISSGIKVLAEKVTQQVLDTAAADPEGIGSSTRSAISSGASQLAVHINHMITGQGSVSTSTLESIISSAVSDLVADMITQSVLQQINDTDSRLRTGELADEVGKLVHDILGIKTQFSLSKSSKTSLDTGASKEISDPSAFGSCVSDLASDVVNELLLKKDSKERLSDESAASAISAVAARYIHQTLGVLVNDKLENDIIPVHVESLHAVPPNHSSEDISSTTKSTSNSVIRKKSHERFPHPPKSQKDQTKKPGRKFRQNLRGMSTGCLQEARMKPIRRQTNFSSSFNDWRNNGSVVDSNKGKSLNELKEEEQVHQIKIDSLTQFAGDFGAGTSSSEEFNNVMENLAARIVASVVIRDGEDQQLHSQVDQELNASQSVEHLVGSLALGVVTSLLGLDVLSETRSAETTTNNDVAAQPDSRQTDSRSNENDSTPHPTAGKSRKETGMGREHVDMSDNVQKVLNLLCSEDFIHKKEPGISSCDDNAVEHPYRVQSPSTEDRKMHFYNKKKNSLKIPPCNNRKWRTSKGVTRKKLQQSSNFNPFLFEIKPTRSSARFSNRQNRTVNDTSDITTKHGVEHMI